MQDSSGRSQFSIAVVLWSADIGGAETLMVRLAHRLVRLGHSVGLVLVSRPGPLLDLIEARGLTCVCLNQDPGSRIILRARGFARVVNDIGSDVCILPSLGFLAPTLRLGGYLGKIIAVEHGDILQVARWDYSTLVKRRLDRALSARWVDSDVAVSEFIAKAIRARASPFDVTVIPNGVDTQEFGPVPRESRGHSILGFAGRFVPGKGTDVLAQALTLLPTDIDWRVHLAGDGDERPTIQALLSSSQVASRVSFLGWVTSMPQFWSSCDLAIVPSYQHVESFGMVAVEAMACGTPVVASRQGGLEEVVHGGVTGDFFEPGDAAGLARVVARYLRDPRLRLKHGQSARQHVETHYDLGRIAERWIDHIRQLVSSK